MADIDELTAHFQNLGLPQDAAAWLLDLWNLIQVLDDAADGDRADPEAVRRATWAIFQNMPLNPFFQARAAILQPVLVLQLLKWEAANAAEAAGQADARSFVWRAGFYDVVLMVCHLCGVPDAGRACLEMYGETFADYLEEFTCPDQQ
jgi:hypothetical protein